MGCTTRRRSAAGVWRCYQEWRERGGDLEGGWRWYLLLRISAVDGVAVVHDAAVHPDGPWPEAFDQDAKDCYLGSFAGVEFFAPSDFDYTIIWPVRISGGRQAPEE